MSGRKSKKRLYAWLACLVWIFIWIYTGFWAWTSQRFHIMTIAVVIVMVSAGGTVLILVSSGTDRSGMKKTGKAGDQTGAGRTGGETRSSE